MSESQTAKNPSVTYGQNPESPESGNRTSKMGHRMRYCILLITAICLTFIMSNIIVFNFTVLCMTRQRHIATNSSESDPHIQYTGYTKDEKTVIFSSVAIGALLAVFPATWAIQAYGARKTFFLAGLITGFATAGVPWAAVQETLHYFVFLRILQGVSFAFCMPMAGVVTANWASLKQHGLFLAALTAFCQLSVVFSMPIAGQLCTSSLGWPSIYYLHAIITLTSFVIWVIVYRNLPSQHPMVDGVELEKIGRGRSKFDLEGMANTASGGHTKIPYWEIAKTPVIWGVWIAAMGDLFGIQLINTFSPQYIREVLGYSVQNTGTSAALPVLFQYLVKAGAGYGSDQIHCISETTKLRVFNTVALGIAAIFMIGLAYTPKEHPTVAIFLMILSTAMFGFNGGGFGKCGTLVSRQYSQFVMGTMQLEWCFTMLASPIIVNTLLSTGSLAEWRLVYLLHAAILLVSNAIFCIVATAKPAKWTGEQAPPTKPNHQSNGN